MYSPTRVSVRIYPPEDGLRTETRIGEYIDTNKTIK